MSLLDPRRGGELYVYHDLSKFNGNGIDMIAALGETTAGSSLPRLRDVMLQSPEGRGILKERPRVNSGTIDMNKLAQYPNGSFGRAYVTWLERCGVTPDSREPVRH
jgi:ubiquinone biosynthesis protein COQ4